MFVVISIEVKARGKKKEFKTIVGPLAISSRPGSAGPPEAGASLGSAPHPPLENDWSRELPFSHHLSMPQPTKHHPTRRNVQGTTTLNDTFGRLATVLLAWAT